jgi:hypothetical protein
MIPIQLDPLPPPPPTFIVHNGVVTRAPLAAQTHGDIVSWNQMASNLEKRNQRKPRCAREVRGRYVVLSLVCW